MPFGDVDFDPTLSSVCGARGDYAPKLPFPGSPHTCERFRADATGTKEVKLLADAPGKALLASVNMVCSQPCV